MIVDCGRNGLNDWGGHAHNDTLSFELCVGHTTFIADSGSFAYTSSDEWHKVFRSTGFHNTVRVDGEELNRFKPHDFWGLCYDAVPQINRWQSGQDFDLLDAEHSGYLRLADPVTHRRQIFLHKTPPTFWVIRDLLSGQGRHTFELFFHIGDATLQLLSPSVVELQSKIATAEGLLIIPLETEKGTLCIRDSWRAPGYGEKIQSQTVCYQKTTDVPVEFITVLYPVSGSESSMLTAERACLVAQSAWEDVARIFLEQ